MNAVDYIQSLTFVSTAVVSGINAVALILFHHLTSDTAAVESSTNAGDSIQSLTSVTATVVSSIMRWLLFNHLTSVIGTVVLNINVMASILS